MAKFLKNLRISFLFISGISAVIVWYAVFYFEARQNLLVTFLDVGQGDSIFIEVPGGNQILIDGGPDAAVLTRLGERMPFWDRSIDLVILTHPEKDHIAGLVEVLRRFKVERVLWTGVWHSLAEFEEWKKLLEDEWAKISYARRGDVIDLGANTSMAILWPQDDLRGKSVKELNETSVIAKLFFGKNSFLFTGDSGRITEYSLLSYYHDTPGGVLDSDVLKVGHHGSKYSSQSAFLSAVSPEFSVIQVGRKNRYGHPASDTLNRLALIGAVILRNDTGGNITLESDGLNIWKD